MLLWQMENGHHGQLGQVAVPTVEKATKTVFEIAQIQFHYLVDYFAMEPILNLHHVTAINVRFKVRGH